MLYSSAISIYTNFYHPDTEFEHSLGYQSHKQHRQYNTSLYQSMTYILNNKIEISPIFSPNLCVQRT